MTQQKAKDDDEGGGLGCLFMLGVLLFAIGGCIAYGPVALMYAGLLLVALVLVCILAMAVLGWRVKA